MAQADKHLAFECGRISGYKETDTSAIAGYFS